MDKLSTPLPFRKAFCLIVLFAGLLYALLTSWANFLVGIHREELIDAIGLAAGRPITVTHIQFLLPNRLVLKEVEMSSVSIKRVEARFWAMSFPKPTLQLYYLSFDSPRFTLTFHPQDLMNLGSLLSRPRISFYRNIPMTTELRTFRFRNGEVDLVRRGQHQHLTSVSVDILRSSLFRPDRFSIQARLAEDPKARIKLRGVTFHRAHAKTKMVFDFDCQKLATAFLRPYLNQTALLPPDELTASIQIRLEEKGAFQSNGKVLFQRLLSQEGLGNRFYRLTGPRLLYRMKGKIEPGSITLREVALRSGKIKVNSKGLLKIENGSYELSLTSTKMPLRQLQALVPELSLDSGTVWISLRLSGKDGHVLPHLILNIEDGSLGYLPYAIRFTKVGGTLRLTEEGVAFSELWAFANNLPIRMTVELLRKGRPEFVVGVSTYPGQLKSLRYQNPLNLSLTWRGLLDKQNLSGDVIVERLLVKGPAGPEAVQRVSCEGLRMEWSAFSFKPRLQLADHTFAIAVEKAALTQTNFSGVTRQLVLEHVQGSYWLNPTSLKLHLLSADLFSGKVLGEMEVGWGNSVLSTSGKIHLVGLQLPDPLQVIERHDPITGSLNGEILWKGPQVSGQLVAADGSIGPSEMLDQFANETGIEALRVIPFKELSLRFTLNEQELEVTDFSLESADIKFSGEWKVREDLIGGRLGARFHERAVGKSSDLRRLIRFVGGQEWIDFDFRIAGNTQLPRMQWLSGEFKKRVEHRLDPVLRKMLEKELEKILLNPANVPAPSVSE